MVANIGGLTAQIGWFGLRVGGHPALSLHSSNEPGELSQWLCHDDSTINIVVVIIIIIIKCYDDFTISDRQMSICNADKINEPN